MGMKRAEVLKSFELCSEAGWFGYDIYYDQPIDKSFIQGLSSLGSLLYMEQLKTPFFRVEGKGFLIKGVEGRLNLRIGISRNDPDFLEEILSGMEQ